MNSTSSTSFTYPKLKPAIQMIVRHDGSEIFVGNSHEGYLLDAYPYLALLRVCTGWFHLDEISERTNQPAHLVEKILGQHGDLVQLGILEIRARPTQAPWEKAGDQHQLHSATLTEIESSLITFRSHDGGLSELQQRSNYRISIFGDTRIARLLLPLLCASGFTQTALNTLPSDDPLLQAKDLNGLSVTTDHLGKSKSLHHRDLIRVSTHSSTSGASHNSAGRSDLIIATSQPFAEQIQQWQSEGVVHIAMGEAIAGIIEISPIIQPGVTPCLRCIQLHKRDALPRDLTGLTSAPDLSTQLPVASAALIAALLASTAANFFGKTATQFHSQVINLLEPTLPIRPRKWNFHPECGCVDVRRRALPR